MGSKLVYHNWNRTDGLEAKIYQDDLGFHLFCIDSDANEVFAKFSSELIEPLQVRASSWLEVF